ncbi:MAG: hypothetical protein E6I34_03130 [Chloroflexi bacterium]|nr:MAG: hypothetical protein E6I34_03130 [Chloroflexota bacterium]
MSCRLPLWEGWADSAEFGALLDAEIAALNDHKGSRLLADCRRQRVLSPVDQLRADKEWTPRALAAGLKQFAIVLPVSALAAMNLRDLLAKVPKRVMEIGYFATVEEARAWLATPIA